MGLYFFPAGTLSHRRKLTCKLARAAFLPGLRDLCKIDHRQSLLDEIFIPQTLFMPMVGWKMPEKKQDCSTTLLIVDDEPAIRTSLSQILTEIGYSVRCAEDGFSALAEIRNEIPDIVLSDLNMPGMSGFEFLSVVRRRFPSIWVIAMSGAFSGDEVPSGVAADDFYQKGSGVRSLLQIIGGLARPERLPANRPSASTPLWIQGNGLDASGNPYVSITCPECLRTFPQTVDGSLTLVRETHCVHCRSSIYYAITEPSDWAPAQAPQRPHREMKPGGQPESIY
jgi:CheY-like chemotaxis protein